MIPPRKLTAADLKHSKGDIKAWNGDKRKPRSDRFNGGPDMEDKGFMSRGVHTVEGTNAPSGVRQMPTKSAVHSIQGSAPTMTYSAGRGPSKAQQAADDRETHEAARKPLTERQKRLKRGL